MDHDIAWLRSMIATRAQKTWDEEKRPYYISYVATDSAKDGVDYKTLIAPLKLRQWAVTNEIDGLKVVEHPKHKAKVGYIPATADFVFDDVDPEAAIEGTAGVAQHPTEADKVGNFSSHRSSDAVKTRRATLQFLETLSRLDDDELDEIIIPVRTIIRLLNG